MKTEAPKRQLNPFEMKKYADRNGLRDHLAVTAVWSRFTYTAPVQSLDALTMVKTMSKFFIETRHQPRKLIIDRVESFNSNIFGSWCLGDLLKLKLVTPRLHAQNEIVERVIQTLECKANKPLSSTS